LLNILAF
jgi:hypothetical protein